MRIEQLAKIAYTGYWSVTGGKNYAGYTMPPWEDLPRTQHRSWIAAVQAVQKALAPKPVPVGEGVEEEEGSESP